MCSSGHTRRYPLNPAPLGCQSLPYSLRIGEANIYPTNNRRSNSELPGDPAIQAVVEGGASQVLDSRDILQGQILSFERGAEYRETNIPVKIKIGEPLAKDLSVRIKELRKKSGLTQKQLAEFCTVSQTQISSWEAGIDKPSPRAMVILGKIAGDPDRAWWWEQAGVEDQVAVGPNEPEVRRIPLLKDAAAAGTPRAIDEREIETYLTLPSEWIGRKSSITAIKVAGDSMTPILDDGYIALVDTSVRDPKRLVNHMVAARAEDGVTIKWLRKERVRGEDMYLLVPNHASIRHQVRVIAEGSDNVSIVGKVVKWIGEPPPPRK